MTRILLLHPGDGKPCTRKPLDRRLRLLVGVVGATFAALRRRLPGVAGVLELALCQFIEARLLLPEQLKLVRALGGVGVCLDVCRLGRIRACDGFGRSSRGVI